MNKIYGNTDSVKKSILDELEALYDMTPEKGQFIPRQVYETICRHSDKLNKEIAVYVNRKGYVTGVAIGEHDKVSLPDMKERKSPRNLSGIRCVHTHPKSSGRLSEVDLGTLMDLRLDAMAAIGLTNGDIYVGLLQRDDKGDLKNTKESGPYFFRRENGNERLNDIFQEIEEIDGRVRDNTTENAQEREKAILVAVTKERDYDMSETLEELAELARTAGATVLEKISQKKEKTDSALYIGRGKAEELSLMRQALGADTIIFDDELTGAQTRNLENVTGAKIIDRTALILDIFAQRARSLEGKLQVELAQMKYMLPRLTGKGLSMSRLGGGIGTRGPGETQLETDRRHINRRMKSIERQLEEVKKRRGELRVARKKNSAPTVSLAGYTNAGKSTIMNYLCPAAYVFAEDMLFATLDSTVRKIADPAGQGREALLVDTVGFIRKLPHDLVNAFRSTLEETIYADLILHVVDASNKNYKEQIDVVNKILSDIGAEDVPVFIVFNKMDKIEPKSDAGDFTVLPEYGKQEAENAGIKVFFTSAKTGEGMEELAGAIFEKLMTAHRNVAFLIPFSEGAVLSALHETGGVKSVEYLDSGIYVTAAVSDETAGRYRQYEAI